MPRRAYGGKQIDHISKSRCIIYTVWNLGQLFLNASQYTFSVFFFVDNVLSVTNIWGILYKYV